LGLDGVRLSETVAEFNAACRDGDFRPQELDGVASEGLDPPKTNWARPIFEAPSTAIR
jgi:tricarballylate dehydrogenase